MPNWCMNKLTVSHEDKSMVDKLEKAYRNDWAIETFYPTPRDPGDPTMMMGEGKAMSKDDKPSNNWYLWLSLIHI